MMIPGKICGYFYYTTKEIKSIIRKELIKVIQLVRVGI